MSNKINKLLRELRKQIKLEKQAHDEEMARLVELLQRERSKVKQLETHHVAIWGTPWPDEEELIRVTRSSTDPTSPASASVEPAG